MPSFWVATAVTNMISSLPSARTWSPTRKRTPLSTVTLVAVVALPFLLGGLRAPMPQIEAEAPQAPRHGARAAAVPPEDCDHPLRHPASVRSTRPCGIPSSGLPLHARPE